MTFRFRNIALNLVIAVIYFIAARLCLLLAFDQSNASPVWAPSGIALAAMLLVGRKVWPGILVGAFTVNIYVFVVNGVCTPAVAARVSLFIAAGNTYEALAGYYLLRKSFRTRIFQNMGQVMKFSSAAFAVSIISALVGPTSIFLAKIIPADKYLLTVLNWWTGDVSGILVITPLLLVWTNAIKWSPKFEFTWSPEKIKRAIIPFLLMILAVGIVFNGWFSFSYVFTRGFLIIPVLIWVALRLDQREVVTVIAVSSVMAIWGTVKGHGPFVGPSFDTSLLTVQTFVCFNVIMILGVWAVFKERHETELALQEARKQLEGQVQEQGRELKFTRGEVEEYQRRIDELLNVLMEYSQLNFTVKAPVSGRDDELDAIALGLNTMMEELRDVRESEKQITEELMRSNRELEQFAYVASHDLQEPLRTVSSYMQLLKSRYQNKLDTQAEEFITFAVDATIRMKTLINDLLAYSRVTTKPKVFSEVDCNRVVNHVIANMKVRSIEASGMIPQPDIEFISGSLPIIKADESHITQLFQNLISNAVKFKKGLQPQVKISGEPQNGSYLFSVKDNGIGIPPEYKDKIFVLFQRLHNRTQYPGTGIGLAICKKIVELYGGTIWIDSKEGEGTTFYFTLKK